MSTNTVAQSSTTTDATAVRRPVVRYGVAAAAAATVTTTVLAAVASAAGVSFADKTGASIPIGGFAMLTAVFSLIGVGLAAVLARTARRPRTIFVRTTVVLTVLSLVPDLVSGFDAASAASLMTLHVIAAAIVIPTVASRLSDR
jgi:hypothetical protein